MSHSNLVQSVCRAMDIVEHIAQSESGLTLSELNDLMGLKQPTIHNLLRTLLAKGMLEKSTRPARYRLGAGLVRLADAHKQHLITRQATKALRKLYDQTIDVIGPFKSDEYMSATLGQLIGGEPMMTMRIISDRPNVLERPYTSFHPYTSAAALIFWAYIYLTGLKQEERKRMQPFSEFGAPWWKTEECFHEQLNQIREQKYAAPDIFPPQTFRVAAPVIISNSELVATLGLGVWAKTTAAQRKKLIELTTQIANDLSAVSDKENKTA